MLVRLPPLLRRGLTTSAAPATAASTPLPGAAASPRRLPPRGSAARRNALFPSTPRITGGSYPPRGPEVHAKAKVLGEVKCVGAFVPVSPKKYNNVAQMIRGFTAREARAQLQFCQKAIATEAMYVLDQAVTKAKHVLRLRPDELIVGQAFIGSKIVGSKPDYKSKGRQGRIHKRVSRLTVHLYEHPALVPGFQSTKLVYRSTAAGSNRKMRMFRTKANVKRF